MLPLDASPEELRTIGAALRRLGEVEPVVFSKLFDPLGPRARTHLSKDAAEAAAVLGRFGLLQEKEGAWEGRHRIRRRGDRFYVMEVGDVPEYHQDVWPETDAMLEVLERTPPGRVLDMGTGTGIVAIEAAARGHRVVATDLFAATLTLALFNAAINGLDDQLELRQGHLFEPVAGETFDLILTAPHYTRIADQLRLEALRTGPAHVAPGGRLVVATFLSWRSSIDGDDGPLAEVETLLKPLVDKGMSVDVAPIVATLKREWFARATVDEPGEFARGLLSRHRFLVTIKLAPLAALGDA